MVGQVAHFRLANFLEDSGLQRIIVLRDAIVELHNTDVEEQVLGRRNVGDIERHYFRRNDLVDRAAG